MQPVGLILVFIGGFLFGAISAGGNFEKESIAHSCAHRDAKTGEFTWDK